MTRQKSLYMDSLRLGTAVWKSPSLETFSRGREQLGDQADISRLWVPLLRTWLDWGEASELTSSSWHMLTRSKNIPLSAQAQHSLWILLNYFNPKDSLHSQEREECPFLLCPLREHHSLRTGFLPDAAGGEQSQIYLSWKNKDGVRLLTPSVSEWIHMGPSCSWGILSQPPSEDLELCRSLLHLRPITGSVSMKTKGIWQGHNN